MPKTNKRKERREEFKSTYLAGMARKRYAVRVDLCSSLNEDAEQAGPSGLGTTRGVQASRQGTRTCRKCSPILSRYTEGLIHQWATICFALLVFAHHWECQSKELPVKEL